MPIIKSAIKRMKQTIVRNERNVGIKKDIKTATKALAAKPSATALSKAQSEIDKAVKKGLIKKSTAARRKSNLAKAAKTAGVKLNTTKKAATKPAAAKKPAATKAAPAKKPAAKKPAAKKPAAKK
jgi:ribosomal protein S20